MALEFFRPGDGILHRLDPRAKLILLAVLVLCFILPFRLEVSCAYLAALGMAVGLILGVGELKTSLRAIAPLLIVIAVLTPILRRGGDVLWAPFGAVYLTRDGLREAAGLLIRFAGLTLSFFAVFRSIDPNDLILALRWFGLSYPAALVLVIVLRFIPTMSQVYGNVRDAHALRSGTGKRNGFATIIPVLTSVLISAVRGIPSLAMTLESRGFGRANRRTEYRALESGKGAVIQICGAGILAVALLSPLLLFP
jgi:energy-coupling factor transport system permease protein